jgi:hypothetical protein
MPRLQSANDRARSGCATMLRIMALAADSATICYERMFVTAQGSPLTRLRRALAGGDLVAARTAASELPHVGLDEAAALLALIALKDPEKLEPAAVRFLGRACLERSFITLDDAHLLVACLAQLERADDESLASFAGALRRLRLERTARRLESTVDHGDPNRTRDAHRRTPSL